MREPLTDRQQEILRFVTEYVQKNGYAPSVREIARAFKIGTPKGAADHLKALERKGYISRHGRSPRALRILHTPPGAPNVIPILGRIAAGHPVFAEENFEGTLELPSDTFARGDVFAVKVKGDSMEGDHIVDGDFAIIKKQQAVANGDIAAVMIENEVTLKRVYVQRNRIELRPSNPKYKSIFADKNVTILGKMVGLIRK